MSVSMYEDKCSQAFRTADHIADFNTDELLVALEQCQSWEGKTVMESDTLQRIIKSLDKNCAQRMSSMNEGQLIRTGFLMSMILPKMMHCQTLNSLISTHQMLAQDHPIKYLLLAAFSADKDCIIDNETLDNLIQRADLKFDDSSPTELAVMYAGLKCLATNRESELARLTQRIESKYGFRLK